LSRYLVVLPDDSARPILDAVNHAKKSLRIKMFLFSDPQLLHATISAHRRGVKVRIMLNPTRRSGEKENSETRTLLTDAGIEVIDSNPAFEVTHEKSMVVDEHATTPLSLPIRTRSRK
jgi:cardiolipin synthase